MGYTRLAYDFQVSSGTAGNRIFGASTELKDGTIVVAFTAPDADTSGISVRLIGTDGVPKLADIPINTSTAAYQVTPFIAALSGGGFVVAWTSHEQGGQEDLYARVFGASGAPTSDEFRINITTDGNQSEPHLEALDNGGFAVLYESDKAGYKTTEYHTYTAVGVLNTHETLASSVYDLGPNGIDPLVRIGSAALVASWSGRLGSEYVLRGQAVTATGEKSGATFTIDTLRDGGFQPQQMTIGLSDGRGLVTWREMIYINQHYQSEIRGRFVDIQGQPQGPAFDIRAFGDGSTENVTPIALADGGFVALYTEIVGNAYSLTSRIFDADGNAEGLAVSLGAIDFGGSANFSLHSVRTDTGETALFFSQFDGPRQHVVGTVLDANGHQVGSVFDVSDASSGRDLNSEAYLLENGSILVVFESEQVPSKVEAQIISPGSAPTPGDDTINGTPDSDTYDGLAGNDTIFGLGGNDKLYGSAGDDKLHGDKSSDLLNGGSGKDKLDGGSGTDTASYAGASKGVTASLAKPSTNKGDAKGDTYSSIENLAGSSHDDKLSGSSEKNVLDGSLGKDTLTGGKGDDTFLFDTKLGSKNTDTITDFNHADDTFRLDHDVFKGLSEGKLAKKALAFGTEADKDWKKAQVIYDKKHGDFYFDRDGSKGHYDPVKFASVDDNTKIDYHDFFVV